MEVALDVESICAELMASDALHRRFLHRLARRLQQFIEERCEVGLEFPAHAVVLSLNHAADSGRGTFDCQRAAGSPMISRVPLFVKHSDAHEPNRITQGFKAFRNFPASFLNALNPLEIVAAAGLRCRDLET